MKKKYQWVIVMILLAIFTFISCSSQKEKNRNQSTNHSSNRYEDLLILFKEFREFQKPKVTDGVPDYTADAMNKQKREVRTFQNRLAAIDPSSWPIAKQVDYHIVRAEMNGLEFDHRVLKPWSRDPCFYAVITTSEPDVPAREGPEIYGALCTAYMKLPLPEKEKVEFQMKLMAIPEILLQAKKNLTEDAKDLWFLGIREKKRESIILSNLAKRLAEHHPDLVPLAEQAKAAADDFRSWLEEKQGTMTAPSGIGIDNYNWYMKNVHLIPYAWKEQLEIIQGELDRALSSLKLEEHRNRKLPKLEPAASKEELQYRYREAVKYFFKFLREEDIFTVPDYMHLSSEVRHFTPPDRPRGFFTQIQYRDFLPLLCHSFHWLEKQREEHNHHPIRGVPLLYNIWDSRAEGFATGFEEMMLQTGLFDKNPRARELVYILLAFRAARAIGDLKMHSNEFTLEEAVKFAVNRTPYGWVRPDGNTIWFDMKIYLHQPGYGKSYVLGKVHIEKLIADRASQLGEKFQLKPFLDEFFAVGVIPVSLIRWEMTGLDDEIKELW